MHSSFDTLIDSFILDKVGIAENFLSEALALHLSENLTTLFAQQLLYDAGTGNETAALQDKRIRSDKIYWLDCKHNNIHENAFFDLMDKFVLHLNRCCYAGITCYEFHYSLYEQGNFYQKHFDQFRNNGSRQYSMITYLNLDWKETDGGELCIHHSNHLQHISPNNCKSIFFKSSELEHEVLVTNKSRMSITGWLKVG